MAAKYATTENTRPICSCGCGASLAGWSSAGAAAGLRNRVRRVYRTAHGTCDCCGSSLDQYGDCEICG